MASPSASWLYRTRPRVLPACSQSGSGSRIGGRTAPERSHDCPVRPARGAWSPARPGTVGYARDGLPGGRYLGLVPADGGQGIEILLQQVPEVKSGKNQLHLDLRTADLNAEVERVAGLGAQRLTSTPVTEWGWRWHILADPDGNEFCILQPPVTYWERQPSSK